DIGGAGSGGFDGREHVLGLTADDGGHAGRSGGRGRGHSLSAHGHEAHGVGGGEDPGDLCGSDLAHRMSGDGTGADTELAGTGDGRSDEEGLSQRGVLDRLIVGFRPCRRRSISEAAESSSICAEKVSSSRKELKNPDFWAPWPGQVIASTQFSFRWVAWMNLVDSGSGSTRFVAVRQ